MHLDKNFNKKVIEICISNNKPLPKSKELKVNKKNKK